jgi:hypothetical protein
MRNKNRRGNNPTQREREAKRAANAAQALEAPSQPSTHASSQSTQHCISKKPRSSQRGLQLPPPIPRQSPSPIPPVLPSSPPIFLASSPPVPSELPLVSPLSPLPSLDELEFFIFEDKENSDPFAGPGPGFLRQPLTEVTLPVLEDIDPSGAAQQSSLLPVAPPPIEPEFPRPPPVHDPWSWQ